MIILSLLYSMEGPAAGEATPPEPKTAPPPPAEAVAPTQTRPRWNYDPDSGIFSIENMGVKSLFRLRQGGRVINAEVKGRNLYFSFIDSGGETKYTLPLPGLPGAQPPLPVGHNPLLGSRPRTSMISPAKEKRYPDPNPSSFPREQSTANVPERGSEQIPASGAQTSPWMVSPQPRVPPGFSPVVPQPVGQPYFQQSAAAQFVEQQLYAPLPYNTKQIIGQDMKRYVQSEGLKWAGEPLLKFNDAAYRALNPNLWMTSEAAPARPIIEMMRVAALELVNRGGVEKFIKQMKGWFADRAKLELMRHPDFSAERIIATIMPQMRQEIADTLKSPQ